VGLTWESLASRRMPVSEAHRWLEALAATIGHVGVDSQDF
jgi:hypothetical protein